MVEVSGKWLIIGRKASFLGNWTFSLRWQEVEGLGRARGQSNHWLPDFQVRWSRINERRQQCTGRLRRV